MFDIKLLGRLIYGIHDYVSAGDNFIAGSALGQRIRQKLSPETSSLKV